MSVCVLPTDNISSDVFIELPRRGRAGYNEEAICEHASIQVFAGTSEQQPYHGFTPIARFLGEQGPWSCFSFHEGPEELGGSHTTSASSASEE
jgi:hypothetical protein